MEWTMPLALAAVTIIMFLGELISRLTKGTIPQMLIAAICFLVGFWTIFPTNILDIAGVTVVSNIMMSFILIHVGTMFNLRDIVKEWKTVVIVSSAIVGIVAVTMILGTMFFGKEVGYTAAAPMTGGGMAAKIMQDAANAAGKPQLGMLAMLIFIMHGFFGFPTTAFVLKKETKRLLKDYKPVETKDIEEEQVSKKKIYEYVPEKFKSPIYYLLILIVLGFICAEITKLTGINNAIVQVLVGIILNFFGVIDPLPLAKADSNGILTMCLNASFMASFAFATIDVLGQMIIQIVVLMVLALIAIVVVTVPIGKILKYDPLTSIAIGLNCFLGFPFNFNLTEEAIKGATDNPEEAAYLNSVIMPKMIIAGIVAVSVVSAVVAGVIQGMIF